MLRRLKLPLLPELLPPPQLLRLMERTTASATLTLRLLRWDLVRMLMLVR